MKTEDKPNPLNRIKAVLAEKQISAKQLASAIGRNETSVSRWCNNRIQPSVTQLQEIALFLDVDMRELLCSTKNIDV
ncbi:helix-turn-helix transcriptional regulator [Muribaculum intestinale]|uniref:XRE family transcriptional regulator n=1 Tax=Muribaculum intestinale TaxID=1796646 RepID=A0A4S2FWJ6_9BACT|nr:helix-turn-helix transcriptional regulator [Muribaculum intestinale]MYM12627.1 helix-turn-helix domain-containing protein [Muribaculum intestinale]TGY73800.1 XRE family transcriptional regulator [Muribaculum intestinale]